MITRSIQRAACTIENRIIHSVPLLNYAAFRPTTIAVSNLTVHRRAYLQRSHLSSMTDSAPNKRQKMSGTTIGTHNGHFHADEALAVFLLRLLPEYKGSNLVRTRDPALLESCDIVVDVGGEYEFGKHRYDHHQRTFETTFPNHNTKLSSAGLVYMHFGKRIIASQTGLDENSNEVDVLYEKLYDDLIEAFDANDNGVSAYDTKVLTSQGIKKRFEDRGFNIASVVNRYNHASFADSGESLRSLDTDGPEQKQAKEDKRFLKASAFVGEQFLMELSDKAESWLPARSIVRKCYSERHATHPSGKILVLPYRKEGLPWSDHLYDAERASGESTDAQVLYVLFPESGEANCKWRIRAVSVEGGGFDNRKDLPDAWKGVRDEELSKVSGIPGCVFVHASGFIGGNQTYEGALEMAKRAVDM